MDIPVKLELLLNYYTNLPIDLIHLIAEVYPFQTSRNFDSLTIEHNHQFRYCGCLLEQQDNPLNPLHWETEHNQFLEFLASKGLLLV